MRALLAVPLLLAFAADPLAAQARLTCTAQNAGQTVCQAEGRCRCVYEPGGTMTRLPAGYRWDCSLLNGRCSAEALAAGVPLLDPGSTGGGRPIPARGGAEQLRSVQNALAAAGYNPGPADGVIGPRTRQALRDFQKAKGLKVTGTPTPETLQALGR